MSFPKPQEYGAQRLDALSGHYRWFQSAHAEDVANMMKGAARFATARDSAMFPGIRHSAYAMGWQVQDYRGKTLVQHGGAIPTGGCRPTTGGW